MIDPILLFYLLYYSFKSNISRKNKENVFIMYRNNLIAENISSSLPKL